ncbi:MAG: Flp pilus assembly complex ATPase component TadA, partial [Clostridium sp.]|nr:Flp pilus assembly complex ATPase component TadA [Clostridium sp.]
MIDMKELLAFAVEQNASDIHIATGIPPKLRINGRLTEVELPPMTPADAAEAIGSTMHDRHKQILKERGEVDFSFSSPETGRFRVNVFMDRGNMAAAYRKVDTIIPRPDQLGIPEAVVQLYKKKRGLVLVTGPTGSGKSTTLASIINKANENLTD